MITTTPSSATPETAPGSSGRMPPRPAPGLWQSLRPLLMRLHFYAGILVGPFLAVAALTGLAYAFAPQIEESVHRHELFVEQVGQQALPLSDQVTAAQEADPDATVARVLPPAEADGTTRVVLTTEAGAEQTAFVDPYTGEVRGTLATSFDNLPARTWLSSLHSSLHLGDPGRFYSETAASWLWVVVLGGLAMWIARVRATGRARALVVPDRRSRLPRLRTMSWHGAVGTVVALGLLTLSATGLTWSQLAGANVTALRAALSWETPSVDTTLPGAMGAGDADGGHAGHTAGGHAHAGAATFDAVYAVARSEGLRDPLQIAPPAGEGQAWSVKEAGRGWPSQQDAIAVDPASEQVTARLDFAEHPLPAKLARWGIDVHMGILFGVWNQIALALTAVALIVLVALGYRMWWQRRPTRQPGFGPGPLVPRSGLRRAPLWLAVGLLVVAAAVGWFLPMFGLPLAAFLLVDLVLAARARRRGLGQPAPQGA